MKRKILAGMLMICAVSLSGCKKSADVEIVQDDGSEQVIQTEVTEDTTAEEETEDSGEEKKNTKKAEKYGHTVETLEVGESKLEYPVVSFLRNSQYLDKLNETIKADLDAVTEHFKLSEDSNDVVEANIDSYYVSEDEKLMSIIYYGNYTPENGEEKEIRFTMNLNLENGENYPLSERADIEAIASILADTDDFKIMNTDETLRPKHKSHIQSYTKERLTELLENADFKTGDDGKAVYPEMFSSLESSSAYLEVGMEVPDSIGSHAEYLVDKAVLKIGM